MSLFFNTLSRLVMSFPESSAGRESACNVGDPVSIPGSGRSIGEEIGYPLQYSWASLVIQLVENPPAMSDTWVRSLLGRSPGEGKGYPVQDSGLEISMDCIVHSVAPGPSNCTETEPDICLCLLRRYRSLVACCRGRDSGWTYLSYTACGISALGGGCYESYRRATKQTSHKLQKNYIKEILTLLRKF